MCCERSMAQKEIPLLHDFFAIVPPVKEPCNQQSHTVGTDSPADSGRASPSVEEVEQEVHTPVASHSTSVFEQSRATPAVSSDTCLGFENLHSGENFPYHWSQGKRGEASDSRDSSLKLPEMDMDALNGSRISKRLRLERPEGKKKGPDEAAVDDLILTMQPPRLSTKHSILHASSALKMDTPTHSSRPASLGVFRPGRTIQKSLHVDHGVANNYKDIATPSYLHVPPADEGSRTGIKGMSVGNILNRGVSAVASLPLGRSRSFSRGAGSDSTFVASQEITPITRQLTIFYGGQAHVFEDVSSDKAEAIMTLAGSSGRSWSTTYSPRPKSSTLQSVSEGSMSIFERERAKIGRKPSFIDGFENGCAISTEIHNALSGLVHKGLGQTVDSCVLGKSSKQSNEMQAIPDHIARKAEGRTQVSGNAGEMEEPF